MPSAERQLDRNVLLVAGILVAAAWIEAATAGDAARAVLFDNVHWTASTLVLAWMVWHATSTRRRSVRQQGALRAFCLAAISLALGQLVYAGQIYYGWMPFPAPADALFMASGPLFVLGFARVLAGELPPARQRLVLLDVAGFALAILSLTLTLYLPHGAHSSVLQLATFAAYPVLMLSASATALLMQLHLRQRWGPQWLAFFLGLCGQGALWMVWNLQILNGSAASGSLVTLGFSVVDLMLAWGIAGWRLRTDPSASFDRLCEGLLRQLPLAMVAMTSAAIGLLVLNGRLPESARSPLLGLGIGVLLFAVFRQTQQLGERDRLIEAERVVAESQAQLQHLAHHDPLTGLPNLTLLRDRVQQALGAAGRRGARAALLFVDLDHFKEVNDTLGHAAGDALLCHVARQFEAILRTTDTVSRQGGDEFTIVLPEIDSIDDAARVAEKVMAISSSSALVGGYELALSMSVGVALFPDDARDFSSLLQCADTAMYRAKAAGRNAYRFYDATMNQEAVQRVQLRSRLAHAIARGELHLHYQPQIDMRSGRVRAAEALLRWDSPELGAVPPARFIPVAEDTGLIVEIGGWVLREACRQAGEWRRRGLPAVPLAVNLSVLQFRRGNLEPQVVEALRGSGLPPQMLELEVTESVMMQDQDRVIGTVERLREMGVCFAIDDFGIGYSSLSYLRRMRVSKLKIDRSFVQDALGERGGGAIVRAMIDMARALDVTTVAEGVETGEQLDFLRECRCDAAQGYWFARPLPPEAYERFMAAQPA